MLLPRLAVTSAFVIAACFHGSLYADEFPLPTSPHVVVVGEGEIEKVPDVVNLTLQISHTAQNFEEAKKQTDYVVGKVIIAAKDRGVLMDDINASKIHAVPQFEWQDQQRVYKGEQVNRTVAIKLGQVDRYNDLVDALLAAGITRLQSADFAFSDRKKLEADALELAMDDAEAQAKTIAKHLRMKLEKPFQVTPIATAAVRPMLEMAAMANSAKAEPQGELKPGKQTVTQRVRIVYLLN